MNTIKIPKEEFGELLNCSIRYALGRKTYIVASVCQITKEHLKDISDRTLRCAERDIRETEDYGMDIDKKEWIILLKLLREEIKNRGLEIWK